MYKRTRSLFLLMLVIGIFFVFIGCAPKSFTPVEKVIYTTTKTLETAKTFRHSGLLVAADFYKQGLMDEELKQEIVIVADQLQDAINKTADILKIYLVSEGKEGAMELEDKVLLYQQLYGKFSNLIMPYLLKNMEGD